MKKDADESNSESESNSEDESRTRLRGPRATPRWRQKACNEDDVDYDEEPTFSLDSGSVTRNSGLDVGSNSCRTFVFCGDKIGVFSNDNKK